MFLDIHSLRKLKGAVARSVGACALLMTLGMGSACSPSSIFGKSEDEGVVNTRNYRRVNLACAGMDLSSSSIDVPTFRKMVHCFNSNGALEPIENLVNRIPDADLKPLVDVGNHYVLNNRKLLYQLERTYNTLSERKILDSTFLQLGRLLENEEFVSSSIALLKEGYSVQSGPFSVSADRNLLRVMERFATRVTYQNTADIADTALTLARSNVFYSLQGHFAGDSPAGRSLRDLTDGALGFLQDTGDPKHVDVGYQLIQEVISGSLFAALDQPEVLGRDVEGFRSTIPRFTSVLGATLADNAQVMDGITSLIHYSHRPIHCLKSSQTVPDGAEYIMREMQAVGTADTASFLKRANLLTLMAMSPLCDFPREIAASYPSILALADGMAIEPAADLVKALYRVSSTQDAQGREHHPSARLLIDMLADTGSAEYAAAGGPAENTAGIKRVLPLLAELNDRGVWDDAMLLLTLPREQDRVDIQDALAFLVEAIPGTDQTVYSVLLDAVSRASPESLYNFVYSLRRFVRSERPLLDPAVTALRQAYYVNDVHPVVDLVHDILADATTNDRLFNTLFIIAEMPEFQASVRLVSDMSKDGRLKELLGAVLTLFHKFALQGRTEIHDLAEPAFEFKGRHNFSGPYLGLFPVGPEPALANASCREIDLGVSLGDYGAWTNPRFYPQLGHFASCVNSDAPHHDDFVDVIEFLKTERTERRQNYVEFLIDLLHALDMTTEQFGYLGRSFVAQVDDLRMFRTLDAVPLFVNGVGGKVGEVIRPALELLRPVYQDKVRPSLARLEGYAGSVLRRADFPVILRYADVLLDRKPEPEAVAAAPHDWARIKRWVWNKECQGLPPGSPAWMVDRYKNNRSLQIAGDYDQSVTTWDVVDGQQRRSWKLPEFRAYLEPVLDKLGDKEQGVRPGAIIDGLLDTLRYFTLPEGAQPNEYQHYPPSALGQFLLDRSSERTYITYFFPGDLKPRVRLVSMMDRLELVLTNADFWTIWPFDGGLPDFMNKRNFGMYFMGKLAESWGDEPKHLWPAPIREKYDRLGYRPATLAETVAEIVSTTRKFEKLVGRPDAARCRQEFDPTDPPELQREETYDRPGFTGAIPDFVLGGKKEEFARSLYNVDQVVSSLLENLPKPGERLGEGGKHANGMRVLRDLLYQVYYSTPPEYRRADFRNTAEGQRNNLSLVMKLVRAGLTREATRHLRGYQEKEGAQGREALADFFESIVRGGTASEDDLAKTAHPRYLVRGLIDPLVDPAADKEHALFWGVMGSIFGIIDAGEGRMAELDEAHRKEIEGKPAHEVERIRGEWTREQARMRQLGFYMLAQASPLGLIEPALRTVGPILKTYSAYLTQHTEKVQDLLRSKDSAYLIRALYEDTDAESKARLGDLMRDALGDPRRGLDGMALLKAIDEDEGAKRAWDLLIDRWDLLAATPEYKALRLDEVSREMLDFLEENIADAAGRSAAKRLRTYVAERLEQGDLDQLLLLARRNPDGFYRILTMLSTHIQDDELEGFLLRARRALGDPPRRSPGSHP